MLPRDIVAEAVDLADHEHVEDSLAMLQRAIASDPNAVTAHAAYIRIKTYYLARYDEVRAEYDALMVRHPDNAVYPISLALGTLGAVPARRHNEWYQRVSQLTPDSVWGRYAKAQLLLTSDPSSAAKDLEAAIDKDPSVAEPYETLLALLERSLKDVDRAIAVAEKMAAQRGTATTALPTLWRLRFLKAGGSATAKEELKSVLEKAARTNDVSVLTAVRQTYAQTLRDTDAANKISDRLRQVDPSWYPERGLVTIFVPVNLSGVIRVDPLAGRSFALVLGKVRQTDDIADPAERLAKLEELLKASTTPVATRFIREKMFAAAEQAGDIKALVADGEILRRLDPDDAAVPARMALALATRRETLREALRYAEAAAEFTADSPEIKRPANTDAELFAEWFRENRQRQTLSRQRALALDALGHVFCQLGDCAKGEPLIRDSVALDRSERNLSHLADALRTLRRTREAAAIAREAATEFAASVVKEFINEPAKAFRLQTLRGKTMTLEGLKGKVVLLNFWATWCSPCRSEMPAFSKLYRRNATRGLEILGVTTETSSERERINDFLQKYRIPYPILFAEGLDARYAVDGLPTTLVIDRNGNVRYRSQGFHNDTIRALEVVLNELLK